MPAGPSSPLSPFFKELVTALLGAAQRPDAGAMDLTKLQISAFEAINDLVRAASPDTLDVVGQLIPVFLPEVAKTFAMVASSTEAREKQSDVQGMLCGVLQVRCAADCHRLAVAGRTYPTWPTPPAAAVPARALLSCTGHHAEAIRGGAVQSVGAAVC